MVLTTETPGTPNSVPLRNQPCPPPTSVPVRTPTHHRIDKRHLCRRRPLRVTGETDKDYSLTHTCSQIEGLLSLVVQEVTLSSKPKGSKETQGLQGTKDGDTTVIGLPMSGSHKREMTHDRDVLYTQDGSHPYPVQGEFRPYLSIGRLTSFRTPQGHPPVNHPRSLSLHGGSRPHSVFSPHPSRRRSLGGHVSDRDWYSKSRLHARNRSGRFVYTTPVSKLFVFGLCRGGTDHDATHGPCVPNCFCVSDGNIPLLLPIVY